MRVSMNSSPWFARSLTPLCPHPKQGRKQMESLVDFPRFPPQTHGDVLPYLFRWVVGKSEPLLHVAPDLGRVSDLLQVVPDLKALPQPKHLLRAERRKITGSLRPNRRGLQVRRVHTAYNLTGSRSGQQRSVPDSKETSPRPNKVKQPKHSPYAKPVPRATGTVNTGSCMEQ